MKKGKGIENGVSLITRRADERKRKAGGTQLFLIVFRTKTWVEKKKLLREKKILARVFSTAVRSGGRSLQM